MHGEDTLLGQNEVHDGEYGFLDFACIACAANDDFFGSVVDDDKTAVETVAFIRFKVGRMEDREFRRAWPIALQGE